jgi:hypothetical protein
MKKYYNQISNSALNGLHIMVPRPMLHCVALPVLITVLFTWRLVRYG